MRRAGGSRSPSPARSASQCSSSPPSPRRRPGAAARTRAAAVVAVVAVVAAAAVAAAAAAAMAARSSSSLVWLCIEHPSDRHPRSPSRSSRGDLDSQPARRQRDWNASVASPVYKRGRPSSLCSAAVHGHGEGRLRRPRRSTQFARRLRGLLYGLYARSSARGLGPSGNRLSAYRANTITALQQMTRGPVDNVIVGAVRLETSATPVSSRRHRVQSRTTRKAGQGRTWSKRWTLARSPNAKSRTPDKVRQLGCPGAPLKTVQAARAGTARIVNDGSFDWSVQGVSVMEREVAPPSSPPTSREQGTNLPTVRDPDLPAAL